MMAKETTPGIILYPEDINRIKRCVKPQYQFAVIYALAQYATDGVMPTIDDLGEGGMVAFEFVFDKVRSALDSYEKGRKQRQDAIRKRWDTEEYEKPQNDTTVYDRIRPNQTEPKTETETETETKRVVVVEDAPAAESVIAIDGKDIREDIERNQIADELILSYRLGRDDRTREALLHDLAEHGEARMREVLDKAADGNTREKISVNYWRAILADKSRASPKGYQQRAHDQSYWDSIEVKFDANGDPIA